MVLTRGLNHGGIINFTPIAILSLYKLAGSAIRCLDSVFFNLLCAI